MQEMAFGPQGRQQRLETLFDAFLTVDDVFAVGVDITAPGFEAGSAILFSGDDEFFSAKTAPFALDVLKSISQSAETALARLDFLAQLKGRGHTARRRLPAQCVGSPLPISPTPDQLRLHPGKLTVGDTLAVVATADKENRVGVQMFMRYNEDMPWRAVFTYHSAWLPDIVDCLVEAVHLTKPGATLGR